MNWLRFLEFSGAFTWYLVNPYVNQMSLNIEQSTKIKAQST